MNKLFLILLLSPLSLFCELNEKQLVSYLHDRIDEKSYQISHTAMTADAIENAYQVGYFTALSQICYQIENGLFEKGE